MHGRKASIRLTRAGIKAQRARVKDDPRIDVEGADWILVRLTTGSDLALACELGRAAIAATTRR